MDTSSIEEKIRIELEVLIQQAILNVLSRLAVEFNKRDDEQKMKFWASGETESGSAGEQPDKG